MTYPRKFAIVVDVEGTGPYVQGKTCKYCSTCKMILVQQDELEGEIGISVQKQGLSVAGNKYELLGVVDLRTFKKGLEGQQWSAEKMLDAVCFFRKQYGLALQPGGWYPEGSKPPVLPAHREQRVPRVIAI
jgi:hypothetical protein